MEDSKIIEELKKLIEQKQEPVDPTANVLKLVEESVKRSDDLRLAEKEYNREVTKLHKELYDTHFMYSEKLSMAESKRIDAIRAVDVGALALANERATAQASVLANQLQQSDERNRNLVATTATTIATQLTQIINPVIERLGALEKAQYESKGKGQGGKDTLNYIVIVIIILGFIFTYFVFKK